MKPIGIFGNNISKCPDIMRKRTPISPHRVPPVRSNKVKDYFSSVGSPCYWKIGCNSFTLQMKGKGKTETSWKNVKQLSSIVE